MRSKLLIPIFVLILLAFSASAFVISGTVTDTSLVPINGAQIDVYDSSSVLVNSTTTNASGDYSLEVGNLLRTVDCSAAGYDPQSTPVFVSSDTTVNFALGPIQSVTLAGYVRDSNSTALSNADVVVLQGGATFTQTVTNGAGYYSVNVIDGDTYDVAASLAGYDSDAATVTISGNTAQDFTLTQTPNCIDNDGDGYGDGCTLGTDFNDNDASQYPGAPCSRVCYSGSTYDVNGACTGGTYTCGGGGGGGSSHTPEDYDIDLEDADVILNVERSDTVNFDYDGEGHVVTINAVYTNGVSLTVESDPVTELIYLLHKQGFNLDGDLANDLFVTVKDISGGKAELLFELAEPPVIPDLPIIPSLPTPSTPSDDVVDDVPPGPQSSGNAIRIIGEDELVVLEDDDEESGSKITAAFVSLKNLVGGAFGKVLYLKYIVAGVVILGLLILVISIVTKVKIDTSNKRLSKKERQEAALEKIKSLEKQIKELKKGF